MNTISQSIAKYKVQAETVFEYPIKVKLTSPREDSKSNLYVCSQAGEIIKFNEKGEYSIILSITGQPNCIAFDYREEGENEISKQKSNNKNDEITDNYYFTDLANSVIYIKKINEEKPEVLVRDYEGNPLIGPTSLTFNGEDNSILFCDGGFFESTSLNHPVGSIYHVDLNSNTTVPIINKCLAYPADIIFEGIIGTGYVVETFANRILKITENPQGIYHVSVFYVFNGRLGPTSLTIDDFGNIYVSRFEYQNQNESVSGLISVLNRDGYLIGEIEIPKMSEINGIYIPKKIIEESKDVDNLVKNNAYLYFTDNHFKGVKRIKLNNFLSEIEKS